MSGLGGGMQTKQKKTLIPIITKRNSTELHGNAIKVNMCLAHQFTAVIIES